MLRLCSAGLLFVLLAGITNGNEVNRVTRTFDEGETFSVHVVTFTHTDVTKCFAKTPNNGIFEWAPKDASQSTAKYTVEEGSSLTECMLTIHNLDKNDEGDWDIYYERSSGDDTRAEYYNFIINAADPENPIEDGDRQIIELSTIHFDTQLGEDHIITIPSGVFTDPESCHLRAANGLQYSFDAGLNIPGVEAFEDYDVECGLKLHVTSTDMIGEWTLIAWSKRLGHPIETRQPFVISVKETKGQQFSITISEGSDLHLSLSVETDMFDTCILYGPFGFPCSRGELDPTKSRSCGYIIRDVTPTQNGTWSIEYGNDVIYRETIDVTILGSSALTAENLRWTLGSSINISLGPEDAVYCKLEDSDGYIVYDGFGQCQLNVDRVDTEHSGVWKLTVGTAGNVVMQEASFWVDVRGADPAPIVTTSVTRVAPVVSLTCSLPTGNGEVRACKFRDPRGNIFIAQHGVGQDGYSTNYESTATSNDCVLRLMNPTAADLGLWRCAMDTKEDTHFAFLTVTCPWLMQDPVVAAGVQTEPVLRQDRTHVTNLEGHPTVISCSVDAAIRYCYFRYRNGTIFNTSPAIRSSGFEYVGAGLLAGDCGIKFNSLAPSESGDWTCHVGLMDLTAPEQSVTVNVNVRDMMAVSHHYNEHHQLVVEASVHDNHPLDYCRFIRITGQGFTQHNAPEGFTIEVRNGHCIMYIAEPNILDVHPWTVVAKLTGVDAEISRDTMDTLVIEGPGHGVGDAEYQEPSTGFNGVPLGCALFGIFVLIFVVVLAFVFIPKKNREWARNRMPSFRRGPVENTTNNIMVVGPKEKEPLPDPPMYQERV